MKFKKILLLFIITLFICSVSSVNATTKEYDSICPDGDHNVTFNEAITKTYDTIVKKDNWYYKKYLIENTTESIDHNDGNDIKCSYNYNKSTNSSEYEKLPSTYVINKTESSLATLKTSYVKGTIYKYYEKITKVLYADTSIKTVTDYDKRVSGYYKTIKMPTLKKWSFKNFKFEYEKIQIGRTDSKYFVKGLKYPDNLKIEGGEFTKKYGSYFFKYKPYKFTIYI